MADIRIVIICVLVAIALIGIEYAVYRFLKHRRLMNDAGLRGLLPSDANRPFLNLLVGAVASTVLLVLALGLALDAIGGRNVSTERPEGQLRMVTVQAERVTLDSRPVGTQAGQGPSSAGSLPVLGGFGWPLLVAFSAFALPLIVVRLFKPFLDWFVVHSESVFGFWRKEAIDAHELANRLSYREVRAILAAAVIGSLTAILVAFFAPKDKKTTVLSLPDMKAPKVEYYPFNRENEPGPLIGMAFFENGNTNFVAESGNFLGEMSKFLSACGTNTKPVELKVYGVASSAEFLSDSEQRNVRLANERSKVVADVLRQGRDPDTFHVTIAEANKYYDIVRRRFLDDRTKETMVYTEIEQLARVAYIRLADPGACSFADQ